MPLAAQGGWKPAPTIQPIDAGIPTGAPSDGGERTKPVIPGDISANPSTIR
jgi:hypothetical protein